MATMEAVLVAAREPPAGGTSVSAGILPDELWNLCTSDHEYVRMPESISAILGSLSGSTLAHQSHSESRVRGRIESRAHC